MHSQKQCCTPKSTNVLYWVAALDVDFPRTRTMQRHKVKKHTSRKQEQLYSALQARSIRSGLSSRMLRKDLEVEEDTTLVIAHLANSAVERAMSTWQ